jgi:hypothetical protein
MRLFRPSPVTRREARWKGALVAALVAGAAAVPLAAPQAGSFDVQVTALDPGITAVAVGDRFTIAYTVEDAAVDDTPSVGAGHFPGLLSSFTMTPDASNTGAWAPTGTFDLGAASNFVDNAFGDSITFQVRGTGFPDGAPGLTFNDIDMGFSWPGDITDSGLGDTFAEQLAPLTFGTPPAALFGQGIRFTDGEDFPTATFALVSTPVPALPSWALVVLAAALVGLTARWLRTAAHPA